jgi:hypothetical protein
MKFDPALIGIALATGGLQYLSNWQKRKAARKDDAAFSDIINRPGDISEDAVREYVTRTKGSSSPKAQHNYQRLIEMLSLGDKKKERQDAITRKMKQEEDDKRERDIKNNASDFEFMAKNSDLGPGVTPTDMLGAIRGIREGKPFMGTVEKSVTEYRAKPQPTTEDGEKIQGPFGGVETFSKMLPMFIDRKAKRQYVPGAGGRYQDPKTGKIYRSSTYIDPDTGEEVDETKEVGVPQGSTNVGGPVRAKGPGKSNQITQAQFNVALDYINKTVPPKPGTASYNTYQTNLSKAKQIVSGYKAKTGRKIAVSDKD